MYKIVKIGDKYNIISDEEQIIFISNDSQKIKSIRDLILSIINGNIMSLGFNRKFFLHFDIEEIDTLESLDEDYIKNKYIHYLI